jgi:hypothetical protein
MRYKDYPEYYPTQMSSRFTAARIPLPYYKKCLDHVSDVLDTQQPPGLIERFFKKLLDGEVLRAEEHPQTCGMGLWIAGRQAPLVAAAVLQEALLAQVITRALFLDANDYADSKKPDAEDEYRDRMDVDLLVVVRVSDLTEWGLGLINRITRKRYWAGLPTIIADAGPMIPEACHSESMIPALLVEET